MKRAFLAILFVMCFAPLSARAVTIIKPPALGISGYTQFGYTRDSSTTLAPANNYNRDDSFRLVKSRLTFKGDIDPMVAVNLQIDIADSSVNGNNKLLTDAYFDLKYLKGHIVRLGQFKIPFGLENPIPDSRLYPISNSYIKGVSGKLLNSRDIGIDVSAKTDKIEYHASIINGNGPNTAADNNSSKDLILSVRGSVASRLQIGGSLMAPGKTTPAAQVTFRRAVDGFIYYTPPAGDVSFEYISGRAPVTSLKEYAWYLLATPKLNDRTWLVLRYDKFDPNKAATNNTASRTTFGLLYKTSKYSLVKVNYEWRNDKTVTNDNNAFKALWQVEY